MFSNLRKLEVWIFLLLLVLVNALFVNGIIAGLIPESFYRLGRFVLLAAVLFGLVFLLRGWSGVRDILEPMVKWKRSPWLYLFAVTWTVGICLLVLVAKGFLTGNFPQGSQLAAGLHQLSNPDLLITLAFSSFAGEIVWISYALRKLSKDFTPYISALIVGAFWTAWWLPMAMHNFGIIPNLPIGALLLNQMGVAAMCAFVYHHSRSGLIVLLMQIVFNSTILVFPVTPNEGGVTTYWAFALTYFLAALLLFLRFGPGPLVRRHADTTCPDKVTVPSI